MRKTHDDKKRILCDNNSKEELADSSADAHEETFEFLRVEYF